MGKIKRAFTKLANWQHFGLLVIVLASAILHIAVITTPPDKTIFDELHYVEDGRRINDEARSERNEHPPLARLIIAKSMELIGDNAWGWRVPSVILSALGLILFYDICKRLSKSHRFSFLATFLLAFENFYYVHGGMAMLDIYVVFFSILAFWLYLKGPVWWWAVAVSGAMAALSKFSGLLVFVTIGLHWLYAEREAIASLFRAPASWFRRRREAPPVSDTEEFPESLPSPKNKYRRILIFVFSMLLAPVAFLLLYAVCEYFIWDRWIDLFQQIKTALSGTYGIKYSYDGAFPSRPWEWLLSPINAFSIYDWIFSGGQVPVKLLGYDWPPWGPHITGMTSFTIWLTSLFALPWIIWSAMKRRVHVILPVLWFIGVGAVPTIALREMDLLPATIVSMAWFALIIPIIFFMKKESPKDNTIAFILFWIIGAWATWIPLSILTDRITYAFYYLPTIPALCLGAALVIEKLLARSETTRLLAIPEKEGLTGTIPLPAEVPHSEECSLKAEGSYPAEPSSDISLAIESAFSGQDSEGFRPGQVEADKAASRHFGKFRVFSRGAIAFFLFFHLVIFCLLGPDKLSISIPASILILAFTMDYLGYSWQTMASAVIAVTAGVLGLRYILYRYLEIWFGTETIIGLYPANIWTWVVGVVVTLAVIGIVFFILRRWVFRSKTVTKPPMAF